MTAQDYLRDFEDYRRRKEEAGGAHDEIERFRFITLAELLARPEEEHPWLLEGMLPHGGTSLVVAKPKVGKSSMAQGLAVAVAGGTPFLGRQTLQGPVLYLAFEEKDSEVANHFRAMHLGVDTTLPIHMHFGQAPPDQFAALKLDVAQYQPVLIIIDTLAYFMHANDFNDYAQVFAAMKQVMPIARESGAHLMCMFHAGKNSGGGTIDAPVGSTAFAGGVDTIVKMERTEQGRTMETNQRYGPEMEKTLLGWDQDTYTLTIAGTVREVEHRSFEDEVLAAIGRRTILETELRDILGCRKSTLLSTLNALVLAGLVIRTGTGHRNSPYMYELAQPATEGDDGYQF